MKGRVRFRQTGSGEIEVRIRIPWVSRVISAASWGAAALATATFFGLAQLQVRQREVGPTLLFAGAFGVVCALLILARGDEVIRVGPHAVVIEQELGAVLVNRMEQDLPSYSPVDAPVWKREVWAEEDGSGSMLFGTAQRGVRFGRGLSPADARLIEKAFLGVELEAVTTSHALAADHVGQLALGGGGLVLVFLGMVMSSVVGLLGIFVLFALAAMGVGNWISRRRPSVLQLKD